jgi:hypothetical protein
MNGTTKPMPEAPGLNTGRSLMPASLVVHHPGVVLPRLQYPTIRTAARTALRFAESGVAIPAIVDEHDELIWEYPGGDPTTEAAATALGRLRALAGMKKG